MTPEAVVSYHKLDGSTAPRGHFWIPLLHLSNCLDLGSIPSGQVGSRDARFVVAGMVVV